MKYPGIRLIGIGFDASGYKDFKDGTFTSSYTLILSSFLLIWDLTPPPSPSPVVWFHVMSGNYFPGEIMNSVNWMISDQNLFEGIPAEKS